MVEGVLRLKLGYGEEISVSNQIGTIYDPDLDDNLPKKLSDLGVEKDGFITVVDEDDETRRVNLELLVAERYDFSYAFNSPVLHYNVLTCIV